jgi:hypothetical protein
MFYEDRLGSMEVSIFDRIEKLKKEHFLESQRLAQEIQMNHKRTTQDQTAFQKERTELQEKINSLHLERMHIVQELDTERAMSKQALKTTEMYQTLIKEKDKEIESLLEQVRDLMVHLESGQKVQDSDELHCGSIVLHPNPQPNQSNQSKRPSRRKRL